MRNGTQLESSVFPLGYIFVWYFQLRVWPFCIVFQLLACSLSHSTMCRVLSDNNALTSLIDMSNLIVPFNCGTGIMSTYGSHLINGYVSGLKFSLQCGIHHSYKDLYVCCRVYLWITDTIVNVWHFSHQSISCCSCFNTHFTWFTEVFLNESSSVIHGVKCCWNTA